MVVDVLLPPLSAEDEPSLRDFLPSAWSAEPALTEFAMVTGPLTAGMLVVVCCVIEVDCAIAAPLIMPRAAAPAIKNLVMCHAFPNFGHEVCRLGIALTAWGARCSDTASDSVWARDWRGGSKRTRVVPKCLIQELNSLENWPISNANDPWKSGRSL